MAYEDLITGTPYDDVFKTLIHDQRDLVLPLLNETFGTNYDKDKAKIVFASEEHILTKETGEQEKLYTDSSFHVIMDGIETLYHYECQSTPDSTMVVRFFQYDSLIALEQSHLIDDTLHVTFPRSAVLYLRSTSHTPEKFTIKVSVSEQDNFMEYSIPIIPLKLYNDIEVLFDKKLYILIPFYIFLHESRFKEYESDEEKRMELLELFSSIVQRLDMLVHEEKLGLYQRNVIVELSRKVIANITSKYEILREGVIDIMGGKVLEYEAKTNYLKGMAEGKAEGDYQRLVKETIKHVGNLMKKLNFSLEQAMDFDEVTPEMRPIIAKAFEK